MVHIYIKELNNQYISPGNFIFRNLLLFQEANSDNISRYSKPLLITKPRPYFRHNPERPLGNQWFRKKDFSYTTWLIFNACPIVIYKISMECEINRRHTLSFTVHVAVEIRRSSKKIPAGGQPALFSELVL